jgi:hypothetical protein
MYTAAVAVSGSARPTLLLLLLLLLHASAASPTGSAALKQLQYDRYNRLVEVLQVSVQCCSPLQVFLCNAHMISTATMAEALAIT